MLKLSFLAPVGLIALTLASVVTPAFALQPSAPMSAWNNASADDKSELLDELVSRKSSNAAKASIRKCVDDAASAPGHSDLPISEIVTACEKIDDTSQPV